MLREQWKFRYVGSELSQAASERLAYHRERLKWWKNKRSAVIDSIRADGLDFDESLVMEYQTPKSRDWERSTRVTIRQDLRSQLDECLRKLSHHTEKASSYAAWCEVLQANPDASLKLDHEDWQFFFSSPESVLTSEPES